MSHSQKFILSKITKYSLAKVYFNYFFIVKISSLENINYLREEIIAIEYWKSSEIQGIYFHVACPLFFIYFRSMPCILVNESYIAYFLFCRIYFPDRTINGSFSGIYFRELGTKLRKYLPLRYVKLMIRVICTF